MKSMTKCNFENKKFCKVKKHSFIEHIHIYFSYYIRTDLLHKLTIMTVKFYLLQFHFTKL